MPLHSLNDIWAREIPLSGAMGITAEGFDGDALTIRAPLAPNINVHGTGFAGSLYAIAALCGWGLVHLKLEQANAPGSIVIASANISYDKPCNGDLVARCSWGEQSDAWQRYLDTGKARFALTCEVSGAATLNGSYAVKRNL